MKNKKPTKWDAMELIDAGIAYMLTEFDIPDVADNFDELADHRGEVVTGLEIARDYIKRRRKK